MNSEKNALKWLNAAITIVILTFGSCRVCADLAKDELDEMITWDLHSSGGLYTQEYRDEMRRKVGEILAHDPWETNRRLIKLVSQAPLMFDVIYTRPLRFTIRRDPRGAYAVLRCYIDRFAENEHNGVHYSTAVLSRTKGRAEQWIELHPWLENEKRMEEIILSDNEAKQESWDVLGEAVDCVLAGDLDERKIGQIEYVKYADAIRDNAPWINWVLYISIQEPVVGEMEMLPVFELMKEAAPECIVSIARHYRANLIFRGALLFKELRDVDEGQRDVAWEGRRAKLDQIIQRLEKLDDYKRSNYAFFSNAQAEIPVGETYSTLMEDAYREYRSRHAPLSVGMENGDE